MKTKDMITQPTDAEDQYHLGVMYAKKQENLSLSYYLKPDDTICRL